MVGRHDKDESKKMNREAEEVEKATEAEPGALPPVPHYNRRFVILLAIVGALGGLLFGYDTGVISGALLYLTKTFNLTPTMKGLVTSIVLAGALIGAITSGDLNDRLGRRALLMIAAAIFALGAVATAAAQNVLWFVIARFVVGYGIGIASYTSPLFISETSPPHVRGALVSFNQLAITLGIVIAYAVDFGYAYPGGWRWMFGWALVPGVLLGVGMFLLPDSPRSLINRGREEDALKVIARIEGKSAEEAEQGETVRIQEIEAALQREKELEAKVGWGELLHKDMRVPLAVGIGLAVLQQFVGINTVIYYAPTIFKYAGYSSNAIAILGTVGVGAVNVAMTIVAIFLLDRLGRLPLLYAGLIGMIGTLTALGYGFLLPEGQRGTITQISLMVYVGCFAFSLGPIFWLMIAEIYPLRVRGRAMSLATFSNWAANLLVTFTFPLMIAWINEPVTFWIYALIGLMGIIFTFWLVPETKGRTLEQIEAQWIK